MIKWLVLIGGGALFAWWLAKRYATPVTLPIAVNGLPADAVFVQTQTIAGVQVQIYSTPEGFYAVAPFAGATRTLGPLSNLEITRILQLQQALAAGGA